MRYLKYYSHEIFSVMILMLLTFSSVFVIPDITRRIALIYAFLFLLHEWEENNYPGGFFDMLFNEVAIIKPAPSGRALRESRIAVYLLLTVLIFPPYFAHKYIWLVLPIVYLGIFEGLAHTVVIYAFKLKRRYTPGMVTALCQITMSIIVLVYLSKEKLVQGWQYAIGVLIMIVGIVCMATIGMRANRFKPSDMPKMVIRNLKSIWGNDHRE